MASDTQSPLTRPVLIGVGSGIAGAAAIVVRGGAPNFVAMLPAAPTVMGSFAVPFFSLLALVGPAGLTFPCWAVDAGSPGGRAWRWLRARFPN
ncbi:MAG: hypothetical protein L3K18_08665 [Thermoplasmata archaeon]|nr:hypothetical protein [Thermoplasmata archaeon]